MLWEVTTPQHEAGRHTLQGSRDSSRADAPHVQGRGLEPWASMVKKIIHEISEGKNRIGSAYSALASHTVEVCTLSYPVRDSHSGLAGQGVTAGDPDWKCVALDSFWVVLSGYSSLGFRGRGCRVQKLCTVCSLCWPGWLMGSGTLTEATGAGQSRLTV